MDEPRASSVGVIRMRAIVLVFGIVVLLVGFSELVTGHWWVGVSRSILEWPGLRWFGLFAAAIGAIVFLAAHWKLIGLRDVMTVMGLLFMAIGFHYVLDPEFWRRFSKDVFLDQPWAVQTRLLVITGLIRIALGAAMIYAATQQPRRRNAMPEIR